MRNPGLTAAEIASIGQVLRRHPQVDRAVLFGSRAKGTHTERSDVDLAIAGVDDPVAAQAIAAELDELPLPYKFEVQPIEHIAHQKLREHIERVGLVIYPLGRSGG